jgi:hypothetical protein
MAKEVVWTSFGLDGVGSYLVLRWLRDRDIEFHYTTPKRFREDFVKWQMESGVTTYSKIFVVNLDLTRCIDVADLSNCIIVDTHQTHIDRKDLYNNAKTALTQASSTTKLLFKVFSSELLKRLKPQQIKLIAMIDDYISGNNKIATAPSLNALYWSYAGDKMQKFVDDFDLGFHGFGITQKNLIMFYHKRVQKILRELQIFQGSIPFQHSTHRVCATFATEGYDEISHHLLTNHQAVVSMIVNLKTKSVFITKQKTCAIPLVKLAERLCDGGGNDSFAGGDVTDKFLEFCKTLQHVC